MPGGLPGLSDGQAPETKCQKAESHTGRPAPPYVPLPGLWAASMAEAGCLRLRLPRKSHDLLQVVLASLESIFSRYFLLLCVFFVVSCSEILVPPLVCVLGYQSPDSKK
jgi:hypothetical protein